MPETPARGGAFGRLAGRLAAEFAIVVLGVTVALWGDSWAAERQERRVETMRLRALSDNVSSTLSDVRLAREDAEGAAQALRLLATAQPLQLDRVDLREALLYGFLYVPTFHPELNVYEDLKSSGELALLTNPDLRRALSDMDARLEQLRSAQADVTTVQQLNLDAYLLTRLDLRSVMADVLGLEDLSSLPPSIGGESELELRNLVVFKLDLVVQIERAFAQAEAALDEVGHYIAEQIDTR